MRYGNQKGKKMKKTTKNTKKTVAQKASKTKSVKTSTVKKTAPVKKIVQITNDTPGWVTALAIILIILGYAAYRFWGIAKIDNVTISRLDYYRAMERQIGQQTLDNLITEALIAKAGRDQNFVVDESVIDDQIATISAQIVAQGQTVEQALAAEGITMEEVRRQYALQQIVEGLGTGEVTVTDAEIDAYITENKDNLPTSLSDEEVKNMVRSQLENQKANQNISTWIENLKSAAEIIRY
jgi:hypothetical protein